ncbi:hypothetical protein LCGC14_3086960 [marine sediment metagenome]|uniref:Uncharacterized protein n=1 Tax=marine sediment metagenome TaxID=412755 RepID=A0A0F8WBJ6_9ZZZZ
MEKIWRVENQNGEGCYQTEYRLKNWICNRHDSSLKHPNPSQDKKIKRWIETIEICGFINKKQALNWFNELELTHLATEGFILKEITVTTITAIGQKQVLAIR